MKRLDIGSLLSVQNKLVILPDMLQFASPDERKRGRGVFQEKELSGRVGHFSFLLSCASLILMLLFLHVTLNYNEQERVGLSILIINQPA